MSAQPIYLRLSAVAKPGGKLHIRDVQQDTLTLCGRFPMAESRRYYTITPRQFLDHNHACSQCCDAVERSIVSQ